MKKEVKEKRRATITDALIPIGFLVLFLAYGIFVCGVSPHVPLMGATAIAVLVSVKRLGYQWKELEENMFDTYQNGYAGDLNNHGNRCFNRYLDNKWSSSMYDLLGT